MSSISILQKTDFRLPELPQQVAPKAPKFIAKCIATVIIDHRRVGGKGLGHRELVVKAFTGWQTTPKIKI